MTPRRCDIIIGPGALLSGKFRDPADLMGYAGVVWQTATLRPVEAAPRIEVHPGYVLNRKELANNGFEVELAHAIARVPSSTPLIISLAGSWHELAGMARRCQETGRVTAIEFNSTCPNHAAHDQASQRVAVRHIREQFAGEVWVKLGFGEGISSVPDAFVVQNSIPNAAMGEGTGALSGPPLLPLTLERVRTLSANLHVPIIASGGVTTQADVDAYRQAGAVAVQAVSMFFLEEA